MHYACQLVMGTLPLDRTARRGRLLAALEPGHTLNQSSISAPAATDDVWWTGDLQVKQPVVKQPVVLQASPKRLTNFHLGYIDFVSSVNFHHICRRTDGM